MSPATSTALAAALEGVGNIIGDDSARLLLEKLNEVAAGPCTDVHELFGGVTGAFLGCVNRMAPEARQRASHALGCRGRAIITALAANEDVRDRTITLSQIFGVVIDD